MKFNKLALCLVLLFAASTCFAQMYTVTDLGTLGGSRSEAHAINESGQVVGLSYTTGDTAYHAFRTAPNTPINPLTDDLGTLGGASSHANDINASGQVVGQSLIGSNEIHAFRTAPNSPINPATDDIGTLGGTWGSAAAINDSGSVAGLSSITGDQVWHAFRTAPNSPINPLTDDLSGFYGTNPEQTSAGGINASGQVVGSYWISVGGGGYAHAFRTAPNSPINPLTDDLGTLGGAWPGGAFSMATAINDVGQVVGESYTKYGDIHAFRTAPNRPINPATDDLSPLTGDWSIAYRINAFGDVVGYRNPDNAFLYTGGVMHDLNSLIQAGSGFQPERAYGINDAGQIVGVGYGAHGNEMHAFLLTPIYKAFVRQPINADGSSVFSVKKGVVPVKFNLTQYNVATCSLLPATIAITRTAGGTVGSIDESTYVTNADNGSDFRIDTNCQYVYNLGASSLGVGTYRVDISINGIMVGHAVFALK
ncbi:MAG TPA: hypothetical protein VFA90_00895 [Terriglobales bacterium]|nr:hypothetical protein [Terriglobales bacterium]